MDLRKQCGFSLLEHLNWTAHSWKISGYFPKLLRILRHFRQYLLFQIFINFSITEIISCWKDVIGIQLSYKGRIKRCLSEWAKQEFMAYSLYLTEINLWYKSQSLNEALSVNLW